MMKLKFGTKRLKTTIKIITINEKE